MKRIRNLLFGVGVLAALGSGVSAVHAEATSLDLLRPCGKETTENACSLCCQDLGVPYYWDEEFGCACGI